MSHKKEDTPRRVKKREWYKDWYDKNRKRKSLQASATGKSARQLRYEFVARFKVQCSRCPENDPVCLDFHHLNVDTKDISIAVAVSKKWSLERIKVEIDKCEVLCSNCHRKLHAKERGISV